MLPGAGDELQGIKKGVLELADIIAVNKTDGENEAKAFEAAKDYISALRLTQPMTSNWMPPVVNCSSLTGKGLDEVWEKIQDHKKILETSGEWEGRRRIQKLKWMWSIVEERLSSDLYDNPSIMEQVPELEKTVLEGEISATAAAERLLEIFRKS
jgi:LAO/AO transport system kinase